MLPHRIVRVRLALSLLGLVSGLSGVPIDRESVVVRHNPHYTRLSDSWVSEKQEAGTIHGDTQGRRWCPLQVGNGHFAFSVDITGLQTFAPCNTLSDWAWHSEPLPAGRSVDEFEWSTYASDHGRGIPFPWVGLANDAAYKGSAITLTPAQRDMAERLRANPHRLNLGRVSMILLKADGSPAKVEELKAIDQTLNLWRGEILSSFELEGIPVRVSTVCHPTQALVSCRIVSPLVAAGRLGVVLRFPYGDTRNLAVDVGNWNAPERHASTASLPEGSSGKMLLIERTLDTTCYQAAVRWSAGVGSGRLSSDPARHEFRLMAPGASEVVDLSVAFSSVSVAVDSGNHEAIAAQTATHWRAFWQSGAALDFSGSTDPRAHELERRVVLSQYLMAVQAAGNLPPQEAGLVNNGWYGKFHLEMFWWHAAHQALWNRWPLLEPSLSYYQRILPEAKALASRQGFAGARWPKMTGPDGKQSPSSIAPFLIWQQPHPLFFAELDYRRSPTPETLTRWKQVVEATAEFMLCLPVWDEVRQRHVLGAPLKTVAENTRAEDTRNPAFELAYWRFGLRIAQLWRTRSGQQPDPRLSKLLATLSPLPQRDGHYLMSETQPDTYENYPWEHPSLVGPLGMLPGDGVDVATMARTFDRVLETWHMDRVWGWDFPMLALCAARLGKTDKAVDMLLTPSPNFQFAKNGFATGGPWPYFPSNGGLLYAVGLMAGGWDGAPDGKSAPGFPSDGKWVVKAEGFARAP